MMKNSTITLLVCLTMGCSSGTKKALPSASLIQEIQQMEADANVGYGWQFDVLAVHEFNKTLGHLKKAKEAFKDQESEDDVRKELTKAREHYQTALAKAQSKAQAADGLTTARQRAIVAGARKNQVTATELKRLDDHFRDNADEIEKMEPEAYAELQKGYLKIELAAIEGTQLGDAKAKLNAARNNGARTITPKAFRQAEVDLRNAQNQIGANRSPESFGPSVSRVNESVGLLTAILNTATREGRNVDEKTATQIVLQNRQIGSLEGRLTEKEMETQRRSQEIQQQQLEMHKRMQRQSFALSNASAAVALQNSIEQARQSFSEMDADVFQQGGKLLIRLKTMNFSSGRAELPSEALAILAKVKSVAQELNSSSVTVEGHTDSVGNAEINEKLSQKRAEAVAQYLSTTGIASEKIQAIGYGFKKPISSNRSAVGRSQNRRVDVVITPAPLQIVNRVEEDFEQ